MAALCAYRHPYSACYDGRRLGSTTVASHSLTFQWNAPAWAEIAQVFSAGESPAVGMVAASPNRVAGLGGTYAPAAFHEPEQFGIHLDAGRIRALAETWGDADGGLSPDDWLICAIQLCHWQLVAHAWLEDLAWLLESMTGALRYRPPAERSPQTVAREHAWANALARRMVEAYHWANYRAEQLPEAVAGVMANPSSGSVRDAVSEVLVGAGAPAAAVTVMQAVNQSLGRDAVAVTCAPELIMLGDSLDLRRDLPPWGDAIPEWKRHLHRLLADDYGYPPACVDHALNCYFNNPGVEGDRPPLAQSYGLISYIYRWSKEVPVHVHGGRVAARRRAWATRLRLLFGMSVK